MRRSFLSFLPGEGVQEVGVGAFVGCEELVVAQYPLAERGLVAKSADLAQHPRRSQVPHLRPPGLLALAVIEQHRRRRHLQDPRVPAVLRYQQQRRYDPLVPGYLPLRLARVPLQRVRYLPVAELRLRQPRKFLLVRHVVAVLLAHRRVRLRIVLVQQPAYDLVVRRLRVVRAALEPAQIGNDAARRVVGVELPLQKRAEIPHRFQARYLRPEPAQALYVVLQPGIFLGADVAAAGFHRRAEHCRLADVYPLAVQLLPQYTRGVRGVLAGDDVVLALRVQPLFELAPHVRQVLAAHRDEDQLVPGEVRILPGVRRVALDPRRLVRPEVPYLERTRRVQPVHELPVLVYEPHADTLARQQARHKSLTAPIAPLAGRPSLILLAISNSPIHIL